MRKTGFGGTVHHARKGIGIVKRICYAGDRASCYMSICPVITWQRLGYTILLILVCPSLLYSYVFVAGPKEHEYLHRIIGIAQIPMLSSEFVILSSYSSGGPVTYVNCAYACALVKARQEHYTCSILGTTTAPLMLHVTNFCRKRKSDSNPLPLFMKGALYHWATQPVCWRNHQLQHFQQVQ